MFLYYNKTYIIIIKVNHSIHAFQQWCSNRTLKIKCIDKISNKVILQQKRQEAQLMLTNPCNTMLRHIFGSVNTNNSWVCYIFSNY